VVLEAGAKLHATAFVLAGDEAVTEAGAGHGADCAADGAANGGGPPRLELTVDIVGPGAEFNLDALFIAHGTGLAAGKTDIDVTVNHLAPDGISRQLIKGIVAGGATGSFTGLVHVAREARRTDASQRSQNLQLSDTAHVFARPQLKIYADDVRCGHGATVGRLDDEAVYYMRQRGVSEAEARRMQMHGFAADIVNHCPSEVFREDISTRIEAIIDRF
jgi:Fe-S cluster assembly protein SufD